MLVFVLADIDIVYSITLELWSLSQGMILCQNPTAKSWKHGNNAVEGELSTSRNWQITQLSSS